MKSTVILLYQEIHKGEVSLYHWPPVWLVWNWLYDYWQFLYLFAKQANPNQSNRRSSVQWYFYFKEYTRGKYPCTIDLLFDWFGVGCMTSDNFCFYLPNRLIQTSQTGGHQYSDTSISGNTQGGSIPVPLTSCLTGLEFSVWLVTIFVFICKTG